MRPQDYNTRNENEVLLMPNIQTELKGSLPPPRLREVMEYFNPQTFDLNKPRGVNFMETCEEKTK